VCKANASHKLIGHWALDWSDYGDDTSLAAYIDRRITFATFFLLTSQTGQGLGNAVMDIAERLALNVGAKVITLNTLDGVEATSVEFWKRIGVVYDPTARVNETWYLKRGYIPYKRLHRYPETDVFTGEAILLKGVVSQLVSIGLLAALTSSTV
jgi:GNAT superfamily N-acetyltransferase